MLTQNTYQAVAQVASKVARAGKELVPQADTPLHQLVSTSTLGATIGEYAPAEADASGLLASAAVQSNNPSHNERVDYFVAQLADAVNNHMDFARNVVLPAVRTISDEVVSYMSKAGANPAEEYCVTVKRIPTLLENESFVSNALAVGDHKLYEPDGTFHFPPAGPAQILDMMASGSANFDLKVREWAATLGDGFFINIWDNYFRPPLEVVPADAKRLLEMTADPVTGIDAAVAVFLLARRVAVQPPEGSTMDPSAVKDLARQYTGTSAGLIRAFLQKEEQFRQAGDLIVQSSPSTKKVVVRAEVYRPWLKLGGSADVVLGALVSGTNVTTIKDFDEHAPRLREAWKNYVTLSGTTHRNTTLTRFRDAIRVAFYKDLREANEANGRECDYKKTHPGHLDTVHHCLDRELAQLSVADTTDVVRTIATVVCNARFYYTDALKILNSIHAAMQQNPGMDIQDAARVASIDYVADYIADQICFV